MSRSLNLSNVCSLLLMLAISILAEPLHKFLHRHMTAKERQHFLGDSSVADFEVIYIRGTTHPHQQNHSRHKRELIEEELVLEAFGRPYSLQLEPNRHLLHEGTRIVHRSHGNVSRQHTPLKGGCHFLHMGSEVTAAISRCRDGELRGFISDGELMLDIAPLTPRLQSMVHTRSKRAARVHGFPHLARRSRSQDVRAVLRGLDVDNDFLFPHDLAADELDLEDEFSDSNELHFNLAAGSEGSDRIPTSPGRKMIELGLYVDRAARETFLPFFDNDEDALVDFILGFINEIQALYYLPSLGTKVDISINYLEIMETRQFKEYEGERAQLLSSFCRYNSLLNKKARGANSWDMGLYLSGLNLFEMINGERSPVTMGLAVIAGVCQPKYSCVIGELGTSNEQGKPYPSAGFTAAFIMAHEMGHNLGMFHDSQKNSCPANGYIMSPSRGTRGETTWSECSRRSLAEMPANCLSDLPRKRAVKNHRIFRELPGQVYDAYDQCQLLLKDPDAELHSPEDLYTVCERVKCKSHHRIGFYYSGPALEGTFCGHERWCISSSCRAWSTPAPPIIEGGWGDWNISRCSSGCLEKATGISISTRRCDNPKPLNTERRCSGPSANVQFCDDAPLCTRRQTPREFAAQKCREFSRMVSDIRPDGEGTQVPHSEEKPWSACSVYCKLTTGTWYTPRQDLNDRGVDTYFPDGTWCHNNGIEDFYCQQHLCKPKRPDPPIQQTALIRERLQLPTNQPTQTAQWGGGLQLGVPLTTSTPPLQLPPTPYRSGISGGVGSIGGADSGGSAWTEPYYNRWSDRLNQQASVPRRSLWQSINEFGYTVPTSTEIPLLSPPTIGPGSPDWPFNNAQSRTPSWLLTPELTTLAPEESNWLFSDNEGVTTTILPETSSFSSWFLPPSARTATTQRKLPVNGAYFNWLGDPITTETPPVLQPDVRDSAASDGAGSRSGRVLWPDTNPARSQPTSGGQQQPGRRPGVGSVRWPTEEPAVGAGDVSSRWTQRPTMPTLESQAPQRQGLGRLISNNFYDIWCRVFGTCR